ncbi:MAG: 2-amino-4-hydroxy-6-hydroxymethyldihydropteridine diphosphokinase [Syntrophaceae bacterium]
MILPQDVSGVICFIGVGSNMGDPIERCMEAFHRLSLVSGIKVLRRSSLYRTEPVGFSEQDWFINAVVEVRTTLSPCELMDSLHEIEDNMGRVRGPKWGPRAIDLDILLYGQEIIREECLQIPHPELHNRGFVLEPLCELASYVIHPSFGVSMRGLKDRLDDENKVYLCELYGTACLI